MPVYQYQGLHYELPDGLSDEQALTKIKNHLGQNTQSKTLDEQLGKLKDFATQGVSELGGALADIGGMFTNTRPNPTSLAGEMYKGAAEAGTMLGTGAVAGVTAPMAAGLKFANDKVSGRDTNFEQDYPAMMGQMTYTPKTEVGHELGNLAGEAVNQLGIPMAGVAHIMPPLPEDVPMARFKKAKEAKKAVKALDESKLFPELTGDKGPQMDTRRPGAQGELFPASEEGLASPYESNKAVEPIQPLRSRAQMDLPLGETPATIAVNKAGRAELGTEDPGLRAAVEQYESEAPNRAAMDEMAQQLQAGQHEPLPQSARGGVIEDVANELLRQGRHQEYADLVNALRAQEVQKLEAQKKAQAELEQRQAAMESQVRKNYEDQNIGGAQVQREVMEHVTDRLADRQGSAAFNQMVEGKQPTPTAVGPEIPPPELAMDAGMKAEQVNQAVENHPLVKKAAAAVTKQEEFLLKLMDAVQNGKKMPMSLVKAKRDLANLETRLEETRKSVEQTVRSGEPKSAVPFNFKNQGGAINPEVFKEGFRKIKMLADGTKLHAYFDGRGLQVEALRDGRPIAHADFDTPRDTSANTSSTFTMVDSDFQKQGLAKELYKFASELGNDIERSPVQLAGGKALWNSFEKSGLSKDGVIKSPGNRQKGALLIDPNNNGKEKVLANMPHLKLPTIVPDVFKTADEVKNHVLSNNIPDVKQNFVQKAINYATKSGLYQALKTDHPVVKFFNQVLTEADRLSRGDVERIIHQKGGFGDVTRALDKSEKASIWNAMDLADLNRRELSEAELRAAGANDRQIAYWKVHREVMDKAFEAINRARTVAGKEPIDRRVAYAAMKSTGDFKRLVYDKEGGKIVGIIGSNFRPLLDRRAEALKEKGYFIGEEKNLGGGPRTMDSAQQALMHNLEILADNDPRIKSFLETMDEISKSEAYRYMNMKKHTLGKKGIFGMEGRKTWESAEKNAEEGMQAQLDYAESALKWARLSEAADKLRPMLSDKDLMKQAPNALKWSEYELRNALGFNPDMVGQHLEQALAAMGNKLGVGSTAMRRVTAGARKTVNMLLLSLDPIFWATNVVQPFRTMPEMKAYLEAKGLRTDFDIGTGYSYLAKAGITDWKARMGGKLNAVEQGAYNYARTHHVYGSDLVEHSNRASKDFGYYADKVGNFVSSNVESGTRQVMFFAFVDMLHQNGLSVKNGLYEAAHNLVDMSMNNYSHQARPRFYNTMGPLGEMSANLMSYKHNEVSRLALLARTLGEDKAARPLLTSLAAGIAFGGIMGTIGFQTADELYKYITTKLGHPDSLTLRAIGLSESMGNALGMKKDNNARYTLSHGIPSLLGLDMSRRLGIGNVVSDSTVDFAAPGFSKLGEVAVAANDVRKDPSEMNLKRLAHEVVPRPVASNMDLEWFSKKNGHEAHNRRTLDNQGMRTDVDVLAKRFGATGIHESVMKDKNYESKWKEQAWATLREPAVNKAKDELFASGKVSPETIRDYVNHRGDIKSFIADVSRIMKKQNVSEAQRAILQEAASRSVTNYLNLKDRLEVYNK